MSRPSLLAGLRSLAARFDSAALRPPAAAADEADWALRQSAAWAALQAWCADDAGPRLAVAALDGPVPAATAFADALARQLDGSGRLDALTARAGRAAGLGWRLQLKLQEAAWWRSRRHDDPWDAGWVRDDPAALQHWQGGGFTPRRATLLLADGRAAAALAPALATLAQRPEAWPQPLRWLWVGDAGDALPPAGLHRFPLA